MEATQKPCWAEECGAQSRVTFAMCPWSGACGLFGQQISLAPVPAALPCSPLHTPSLSQQGHYSVTTSSKGTVIVGTHYDQKNILKLKGGYLLCCAKWCSHVYLFKNNPWLSASKCTLGPITELSGLSVAGWIVWWPGRRLALSFNWCLSKGPSLRLAWKIQTSRFYTAIWFKRLRKS